MIQGPTERRWASEHEPAFTFLLDFFTNTRSPVYAPLPPLIDDLDVWAERELLSKPACAICAHAHHGRCWHLVMDQAKNAYRLCGCVDHL